VGKVRFCGEAPSAARVYSVRGGSRAVLGCLHWTGLRRPCEACRVVAQMQMQISFDSFLHQNLLINFKPSGFFWLCDMQHIVFFIIIYFLKLILENKFLEL